MHRSLAALLVLLGLLIAPGASGAQGTPSCQFLLGFAALHDLIPDHVGTCLDDEQHNPANGDALQHTTGGLLVWRKLDNWTAFTDGYQTWINGPNGLARRLNTQRFSWEANPEGLPVAEQGALFAPFMGSWVRHGMDMSVLADGTATIEWRIYTWCEDPNATGPCDKSVGNLIVDGGQAAAFFDHVVGNVAYGRVSSTNEPGEFQVGPISMTLQSNGTVELDQGAVPSHTLCNPKRYDPNWCGA